MVINALLTLRLITIYSTFQTDKALKLEFLTPRDFFNCKNKNMSKAYNVNNNKSS
jgi:hypothetical protein